MCGLAGALCARTDTASEQLAEAALKMARAIAHRGPDDSGVWADAALGIAIAHRRLAIIDLSPEGHQPMRSPAGRYVGAFNGEIYNYPEMRAEIEQTGRAPPWRGQSDTEVLLAACDLWGIEGAIRRANGMFAIAIVDLSTRELVLARDRMGEKPLYYGWQGSHFLFGSELKALRAHPQFRNELDLEALGQYVRYGYVPAPRSIYRGISKLQPGGLVQLPLPGRPGAETSAVYWKVPAPAARALGSEDQALEELHTLLTDAVRCRLHADVPLGAFLSGGIDSSLIVALMQKLSARPVHTYSIGFHETSFDESGHARAVAEALGTEHRELYVTSADALSVVPSLPELYDEPFADSSGIPTYLLSRLTRQYVTVALSGDGGDELFGGYVRYVTGAKLLSLYRLVPGACRRVAARALRAVAAPRWDRMLALTPRSVRVALSSDYLSKLADVLPLADYREMYARLVAQWPGSKPLLAQVPRSRGALEDELLTQASGCPISWMMYADQQTYLPDDILVKVDRASMAVALETRVPFLDHRVVEFAAALPLSIKIRGGAGKWALRQLLLRYLDGSLTARPKQGFAVPIAEWLRGPLREWAQDLLSPEAIRASGLLDPVAVSAAWNAHLDRRRNLHHPLWVVLMFQAWHRRASPSVMA